MTDILSSELARDSGLLDRIADGDEIAQGVLFDTHGPVVYGLALRLTGDAEEASDVVTSVFRTVWQQSDDARMSGLTLRAWLVALCRQVARERPRQPRLVGGGSGSGKAPAMPGREGREVVLPLPSAEDIQRREHVQTAMLDLTESTSSALELVFFDGLSIYDAAQRLGMPTYTVRTLVSSAMQALRHTLRPVAIP